MTAGNLHLNVSKKDNSLEDTGVGVRRALGDKFYDNFLDVLIFRFEALKRFFSRRYFSRRWVLQERTFGRNGVVRWGSHYCDSAWLIYKLENLSAMTDWYMPDYRVSGKTKALRESMVGMSHGLESATRLLDVKQTFEEIARDWTDHGRRILHCLQTYGHMGCSDPRDRLYALASLSEGFTKVIPGYSLPASDVYTAFAANLVRRGEVNYVITVAVAHRNSKEKINDYISRELPSWAPDLRLSIPNELPIQLQWNHGDQMLSSQNDKPVHHNPTRMGGSEKSKSCEPESPRSSKRACASNAKQHRQDHPPIRS
jgi:hypothetical protein